MNEKVSRKNIVVVGSSNTDMVVRVPHIPKPGETILGGAFSIAQGGKGANQAMAAHKAGGNVVFIARVGDDPMGHAALEAYSREGLDLQAITLDPLHATGVALINVSAEGENSISVASGANGYLTPGDVERFRHLLVAADVILMQLETPIETVLYAARLAKENGVTVILNPAPAQYLPDGLFPYLDVITPNETETQTLTGIWPTTEASMKQACHVLMQKGVRSVLITLGARGVYHSQLGFVKGFVAKAVDTTAAGDVFNGAFAVATASGESIGEALRFANAAAALSVQRPGAQSSIPLLAEIREWINNNTEERALNQFP